MNPDIAGAEAQRGLVRSGRCVTGRYCLVERLTHLFSVWQDNGADNDCRFSEEKLGSLEPSPEWPSFVASLALSSPAHSRAHFIETILGTSWRRL